jgi:outer membrane protein
VTAAAPHTSPRGRSVRLGPLLSLSCLATAAFGLPAGPAAAAGSPTAAEVPGNALTLDDCVKLAEQAPSPVAVARRQQEIAEARLASARAGLLPKVAAFAGYTRNSALPGAADTGSFVSLNGINQYTGLLTVTEEVDLSGRLRAGMARARADQDIAAAALRIQRHDLRRTVAAAYHRLLLARHLVQVGADALAEAEQFAARTLLLAQKGEAARADIMRASAQAAALRQAHGAAKLDVQLANQELAAFFRDDLATPLALVDVLEPIAAREETRADTPAPPPALREPGLMPALRRPELALLDAQRRGLEAEARAARALRLPQAGITAEYGVDANQLAWRDRGFALLLTLTIPLIDWGNASNTARQFAVAAEQAQIERAMMARTVTRIYAAAEARASALHDQIGIARQQVGLAEESLKLSRIRYEGGEGSALEVLTAQNELTQARSSYFTAIAGRLQAEAELVAAGSP